MVTCIAQQSSTQLPFVACLSKLHFPAYESEMSSISTPKRFLSKQNDDCTCCKEYSDDCNDTNKRTKKESSVYESNSKYTKNEVPHSTPGFLRRRSCPHTHFTYIKNVLNAQTNKLASPFLSIKEETLEKNMLVCQRESCIINNDNIEQSINSNFLTCSQLATLMKTIINTTDRTLLIIDCGSPLRHTEKRIQTSILLNANDKISRKRLSTRGLKNFLDSNHLDRLDSNKTIVLYDDMSRPSSCANSTIPLQMSLSVKCVYDEIKRYDIKKTIYVLESSFDEFYQQYPSLCYISTSTDDDLTLSSPLTANTTDIESYPLSEILPGLYLGNSRDAEDLRLLQQYKIKTIVNISSSIPSYFEKENLFKYTRVPCHDSSHQNILQYFETTFERIHREFSTHNNIFVHCQGGVSRSPSFIIGYLMKYYSKTFDEAYRFVKDKRSIVNPNLNFLCQLKQYEQHLSKD